VLQAADLEAGVTCTAADLVGARWTMGERTASMLRWKHAKLSLQRPLLLLLLEQRLRGRGVHCKPKSEVSI
jgi:hypothetical protein